MIFKINFSTLFDTKPKNTYVSFCENKMFLSRLDFQNFLYSFLTKKRIIKCSSNAFICEIAPFSNYKKIHCYIRDIKSKLFCTLEVLELPVSNPFPYSFLSSSSFGSLIGEPITYATREQMRREIDQEVLEQLNINNHPGTIRNISVDEGINGIVNVNVNLNMDAYPLGYIGMDMPLDQPIQVEPIDE